jgi:hypothetical protein
VTDLDIVDPTYSGIMFQTDYAGGQPLFPVADTIFTNTTISGAKKSGDAFDAKSRNLKTSTYSPNSCQQRLGSTTMADLIPLTKGAHGGSYDGGPLGSLGLMATSRKGTAGRSDSPP